MECPCLCICVIFVMGVSFKIMWGMSGVRVRDYENQNLRYPPTHAYWEVLQPEIFDFQMAFVRTGHF